MFQRVQKQLKLMFLSSIPTMQSAPRVDISSSLYSRRAVYYRTQKYTFDAYTRIIQESRVSSVASVVSASKIYQVCECPVCLPST